MSTPSQQDVQNVLLRALPPEDFEALAPQMELVTLQTRRTIVQEGRPVTDVYFPESGLCSKLAVGADRESIEVAMYGREGMSDMVFEPGQLAPLRSVVQANGEAWRIPVKSLIHAQTSAGFMLLMLKYQQTVTTQTAFTALSHGSFSVVERLARWLLMCQDRIGDDIPMVHEFMSHMLAVRRAGITGATHLLEGEGSIKATRGLIQIRERTGLLRRADGSYGHPEAEYERLIGDFGRQSQ